MGNPVIALFQNDSVVADPAAQLEALASAARTASEGGAVLLITPELFMTGYHIPGRVDELAETVDGPFLQAAGAIAAESNIALLVGYPERSDKGTCNSAALIGSDGSLLLNHRKFHLSGPYEKGHFIVDDNEVQVANVGGLKVAPLICYDVEFPEAVRAAALKGAELVAVPTALVEEYEFLTRTLIPTRAFENGLFVAYVNHAGSEPGCVFCGHSTFASPFAELQQVAGNHQDMLFVEVDQGMISKARARLPYLSDRRPDLR
jgi:predicted amidohydrolase